MNFLYLNEQRNYELRRGTDPCKNNAFSGSGAGDSGGFSANQSKLRRHDKHSYLVRHIWLQPIDLTNSAMLKLTWTVINQCRRQPYFLYQTFIWNRVLARCMSWLISFAWASSSCKERKRVLQNEKFFLPAAGFELTAPGFGGQRRNH